VQRFLRAQPLAEQVDAAAAPAGQSQHRSFAADRTQALVQPQIVELQRAVLEIRFRQQHQVGGAEERRLAVPCSSRRSLLELATAAVPACPSLPART
jgi:hypothetical protein